MKSAKPAAARGLAALGGLQQALRERERQAQQQAALERATAAAAERQQRVFADAVGAVTPLPAHGKTAHRLPGALPLPRQRELDEQAALQQALSDEVDIDTLLLTDEGLSYHGPGVGADVVTRLRRGRWAIQGELDLHGARRDQARERLGAFLREAARRGWRCLRVVHGKGHGSPGRQGVLKDKVRRWLAQSEQVLAFTQASAPQGGAGALIVLLRG